MQTEKDSKVADDTEKPSGKMTIWAGSLQGQVTAMDMYVVPVPVGEECTHCKEIIRSDQKGMTNAENNPTHRECIVRGFQGSIGYIRGAIPDDGKSDTDGDPPGFTTREIAIATYFFLIGLADAEQVILDEIAFVTEQENSITGQASRPTMVN